VPFAGVGDIVADSPFLLLFLGVSGTQVFER
jgi:hypothetical protein